jgi:hypothetical protein
MNERDIATSVRIGLLVGAAMLLLQGFGVTLPESVVGASPFVALIVIAGIRLYVKVRGADNTKADETLDAVEQVVEEAAKKVQK